VTNPRKCEQPRIGFVPTMGALHAGHLSLVEFARQTCDLVVVSLFVNPTQFNDTGDFENYPQPGNEDLALCRSAGVDCVFAPAREELYPDGYRFRMTESEYSRKWEGQFRPGHFDGVLSVVLKLFMIVQPTHAWFGEKDWQQLRLIEDMTEAYFLGIEIRRGPTVRESDGLALSSRNARLSRRARAQAPDFHQVLESAESVEDARRQLGAAGFEVEYVAEEPGRRLGAVVLDGVRLIDNLPVPENERGGS